MVAFASSKARHLLHQKTRCLSHDSHVILPHLCISLQLSLITQVQPSGQAPAPRGQRSHRGPIGPLKPEQVPNDIIITSL